MVNSSKKLPCGHIFHTSCLRSWFQRQQTCPTCRLNILRNQTNRTPAPGAAQAPGAAENQNNNNVAAAEAVNAGAAGNAANPNLQPQRMLTSQHLYLTHIYVSLISADVFANLLGGQGLPPFHPFNFLNANAAAPLGATNAPPFMPLPTPPFPVMSPFMLPPPPMPPALDTLTDEELRNLEGTERQHVEKRIEVSFCFGAKILYTMC